MPRFTAPPPNGDSRKALEQRARQASLPAAPEKKGRWPFPVAETPVATPASGGGDKSPAKRPGRAGQSQG